MWSWILAERGVNKLQHFGGHFYLWRKCCLLNFGWLALYNQCFYELDAFITHWEILSV